MCITVSRLEWEMKGWTDCKRKSVLSEFMYVLKEVTASVKQPQ